MRYVDLKDLIGREEVKLDKVGIEEYIKDKVVLVTGGGGSIGSELCRQIAKYSHPESGGYGEHRPGIVVAGPLYYAAEREAGPAAQRGHGCAGETYGISDSQASFAALCGECHQPRVSPDEHALPDRNIHEACRRAVLYPDPGQWLRYSTGPCRGVEQ